MGLTVKERILLYLLEMTRMGKIGSAMDLTQDGISEQIGIRVTHVPRSTKPMEEAGLVESSKEHVRGSGRRRIVYRFTREGLIQSRKLEEGLLSIQVPVMGTDGKMEEMTVEDILSNNVNASVRLILQEVDVVGSFNMADHLTQDDGGSGNVHFPHPVSVPDPFAGRTGELRSLTSFLSDDQRSVMVVSGPPGSGRRSLVAKALNDSGGGRNVIWVLSGGYAKDEPGTVRHGPDGPHPAVALDPVQELERCLRNFCALRLQGGGEDLGSLIKSVSGSERQTVMVVMASGGIPDRAVDAMVSAGGADPSCKTVMLSQQPPEKRWDVVDVLELGPMGIEECRDILTGSVPDDEIPVIYQQCGGIPGCLIRVSQQSLPPGSEDMSPEERAITRFLLSQEKGD